MNDDDERKIYIYQELIIIIHLRKLKGSKQPSHSLESLIDSSVKIIPLPSLSLLAGGLVRDPWDIHCLMLTSCQHCQKIYIHMYPENCFSFQLMCLDAACLFSTEMPAPSKFPVSSFRFAFRVNRIFK